MAALKQIRIYIQEDVDDDLLYWCEYLKKEKISPAAQAKKMVLHIISGNRFESKFPIPENPKELCNLSGDAASFTIKISTDTCDIIDKAINQFASSSGESMSRSGFVKTLIRSTFASNRNAVSNFDSEIANSLINILSEPENTINKVDKPAYKNKPTYELNNGAKSQQDSEKLEVKISNTEEVPESKKPKKGIKTIPGLINMGEQFSGF